MSVRSYTDKELTDLIVSDLDQGIIAFTNQYKADCLRFIASKLRHPDSALMSDYEHEDIFMNCLAITFENIQNQKFTPVNTIKNYFLGICENQIRYEFRKRGIRSNWVSPDMPDAEFILNEMRVKSSKRKKRYFEFDPDTELDDTSDEGMHENYENPVDLFSPPSDLNEIRIDESKKILTEWERKGNNCPKMMDLFHFKNQSLNEIAEELGYENESVVRTLISRCRKNLKKEVEKRMLNEL